MKKNNINLSVFDANPFVLFSVFFTVSFAISVAFNLFHSEPLFIGVQGIIGTALFCAVPVVTIVLFDIIPLLRPLNDDNCSLWISIPVHFVISCGLLLLAILAWGVLGSSFSGIFWGVIVTYMQGYTVIILGAIIIDVWKTKKANNQLKKIQENQETGGKQI